MHLDNSDVLHHSAATQSSERTGRPATAQGLACKHCGGAVCGGKVMAGEYLKGLLQEVGAVDVGRHARGPVRGGQVAHVFGALAQAGEAQPKEPDQGLQGSQLGRTFQPLPARSQCTHCQQTSADPWDSLT